MKTIIILALMIFSVPCFSYEAIVIVLEAPLLKEANLSSKVLQFVRKGQRVFVPQESFRNETIPDYFQTFDRAGNMAYIPSRYVKVILEDSNEEIMPIAYPGIDSTDYRLEEPIPVTYPFEDRSFLRASISYSMGSNSKSPYDYNSNFYDQDYSVENGARLALTKKTGHDKYDRFYFGLIGMVTTTKNRLTFSNQSIASESRDRLRLGPILTYDVFKNEKYRATFGTGFTFNYHRASIVIANEFYSEERLFSSISLAPFTSFNFQYNNLMPNVDFVSGMDFSLFLPHSFSTKDNVEVPELWGENILTFSEGIKPHVSGFLGLQVKY